MLFEQFVQLIPTEGIKIVVALFLGFLIGLEREENKANDSHYAFGGIRSFPLIALIGYSVALLSNRQLLPEILGFLVVGGFLMISYWHKITTTPAKEMPGVTSELSGLITYLVGALVCHDYFWIATTIIVASMLLLALKEALEGLSRKIAPNEILTLAKFLLLSAVILPALPNQSFGMFRINPFTTWLVVVAVCTISYGSYILMRLTKTGGVMLSAVLGGIYSSTATTVALAKHSTTEAHPHLFAGATLIASAFMYLRLILLVGIFNGNLLHYLLLPFLILAAGAIIGGWLWAHRANGPAEDMQRQFKQGNPLELRAAFFFAALFLIILAISRLVISHIGHGGVYALGAIIGFADVDPFVMSMTQTAGSVTGLNIAAGAILLAAASNNLAKGIYAYAFGKRGRAGRESLFLLLILGIAGLIPLLWL
jgi:uncharacterized membrane protein (DUF4010 family)